MVRLNPISLSGGSSGRDASDVAVFRLGWRRIEMRFSWLARLRGGAGRIRRTYMTLSRSTLLLPCALVAAGAAAGVRDEDGPGSASGSAIASPTDSAEKTRVHCSKAATVSTRQRSFQAPLPSALITGTEKASTLR